MTKERAIEILDNILGWGLDHSAEFFEALIEAAGITAEELMDEFWIDVNPEDNPEEQVTPVSRAVRENKPD